MSKVFCSSTHEHVIREESGWYVLGRASTDSTTSERQADAARCAQLKFRIWSEGSVVVDLDRKLVAQRASWNAYTPVGFQI